MAAVDITLSGPLFTKDIDNVVRDAILEKAMASYEKRVRRTTKWLGTQRNPIPPGRLTGRNSSKLTLTLRSPNPQRWPRRTGFKWKRENTIAVRAMSPNVLRSAVNKIVAELN